MPFQTAQSFPLNAAVANSCVDVNRPVLLKFNDPEDTFVAQLLAHSSIPLVSALQRCRQTEELVLQTLVSFNQGHTTGSATEIPAFVYSCILSDSNTL